MAVRLRDLNTVEWHTLNRLARGASPVKIDDEALASLLQLGLAERKGGGFVLSPSGQDLLGPLRARPATR
jgi:hypothetical protein